MKKLCLLLKKLRQLDNPDMPWLLGHHLNSFLSQASIKEQVTRSLSKLQQLFMDGRGNHVHNL